MGDKEKKVDEKEIEVLPILRTAKIAEKIIDKYYSSKMHANLEPGEYEGHVFPAAGMIHEMCELEFLLIPTSECAIDIITSRIVETQIKIDKIKHDIELIKKFSEEDGVGNLKELEYYLQSLENVLKNNTNNLEQSKALLKEYKEKLKNYITLFKTGGFDYEAVKAEVEKEMPAGQPQPE